MHIVQFRICEKCLLFNQLLCGLFDPTCEGVKQVPELVRVNRQVKIGHHTSHIFTIEIVSGGIDVPHTPVGIVVAVGAGTEWPLGP